MKNDNCNNNEYLNEKKEKYDYHNNDECYTKLCTCSILSNASIQITNKNKNTEENRNEKESKKKKSKVKRNFREKKTIKNRKSVSSKSIFKKNIKKEEKIIEMNRRKLPRVGHKEHSSKCVAEDSILFSTEGHIFLKEPTFHKIWKQGINQNFTETRTKNLMIKIITEKKISCWKK